VKILKGFSSVTRMEPIRKMRMFRRFVTETMSPTCEGKRELFIIVHKDYGKLMPLTIA